MRRLLLWSALALLTVPAAQAQSAPMKWGDIPDAHLDMTTFPADTAAAAVILGEYGLVTYNDSNGKLEFRVHRRVKLLTEAAYDEWGTVSIGYGRFVEVRDVKGQTFVPEGNGKAKRHKMGRKEIFKEKVSDTRERIRFTLPALEPGAVIEYSYRYDIDGVFYPPSWQFQHQEPTLLSEFRFQAPEELQYVFMTKGHVPFSLNDDDVIRRPSGDLMQNRWVAENIPALRDEPYVTTLSNYFLQVEPQIRAYLNYNQGWVPVLTDWNDLAENLRENGDIWNATVTGEMKAAMEAAIAGIETPKEQVAALHRLVREHIEWNGRYGTGTDEDLDEIWEEARGTAAEINLVLLAMLRNVGIESDPVLISTRTNGKPIEIYPIVSQFNYLIISAKAGGRMYYLDASDRLRPYEVLPVRALNGRGWVLKENSQAWTNIATRSKYEHEVAIQAALHSDGTLRGTLTATDGGYSGVFKRHKLDDEELADYQDYIREVVFDENEAVVIDTFTIANEYEADEALQTTVTFEVPEMGTAAGDFIYVSPYVVDVVDENPFKSPTRAFPVEIGYPQTFEYTLELTVPEGFVAVELPRNRQIRLPRQGGLFRRRVSEENGVITIDSRLQLRRSEYAVRDYEDLRTFYDEVVAAYADQIVLQRGAAATAEGSGE